MIESLNAIRSLRLAPVFEYLYFGKEVPADLTIYMRYPKMFHNINLAQGEPLTEGGLIPIVGDGNGDEICLFDPRTNHFVVKAVEEPEEAVREFASWQQYLAYALLDMADSGLDDDEVAEVAEAIGFRRTDELIALLEELETLPDDAADKRCERFIRESVG
jgi:hypothetical protein